MFENKRESERHSVPLYVHLVTGYVPVFQCYCLPGPTLIQTGSLHCEGMIYLLPGAIGEVGKGSLRLSVSIRGAFCTITISILLNSGGAHGQYRAPSSPYSSNVQIQVEKISSTPKASTSSPSIPTGPQEVATGLTSTVLS